METFESTRIHAAALIVGCHSDETSHWEAVKSLSDWMKEEGVPGISGNYHLSHNRDIIIDDDVMMM